MSHIKTSQDHPDITTITFNRPEKRNALSIALMTEFIKAIEIAKKNARVLIVRAEGPVFCAGLDLKEAQDPSIADESEQLVAQALQTIYAAPIPVIAAVHGAALAGGAGVMAACDYVVASEDCKFGFPEVKRGLVAAQVMSLLSRQLGQRHLRELLLFSSMIDAKRAHEIGLINRIVPQDKLYDSALAAAKEALLGAPIAISQTKELIDEIYPASFIDDINLGLEYHHEARISPEAKEGIEAFLNKRNPKWVE